MATIEDLEWIRQQRETKERRKREEKEWCMAHAREVVNTLGQIIYNSEYMAKLQEANPVCCTGSYWDPGLALAQRHTWTDRGATLVLHPDGSIIYAFTTRGSSGSYGSRDQISWRIIPIPGGTGYMSEPNFYGTLEERIAEHPWMWLRSKDLLESTISPRQSKGLLRDFWDWFWEPI
jgi:hypothetical protein